METKLCNGCGEVKPKTDFPKRSNRPSGIRSKCKACVLEYQRKRRKQEMEEDYEWYLEKNKIYRRNQDPEKVKEGKRASYRRCKEKDPEKFYQQRREWWENNKEKARAANTKWAKNNKLKRQEHYTKYKTRKLEAFVEDIDRELVFVRDNGECQMCGKQVEKEGKNTWHLDHIVPLSRGGKHCMDNVQVLCPFCNTSKGTKLPEECATVR